MISKKATMKFEVKVTQINVVSGSVTVEASSCQEAEEIVMKMEMGEGFHPDDEEKISGKWFVGVASTLDG